MDLGISGLSKSELKDFCIQVTQPKKETIFCPFRFDHSLIWAV
ncbi:MAG: hypothetical protein CM1200mP3_07390 [Chloroflexota bacterium]|nr:MAG: hypothetical protein CM1200mP3_07390 [Chloroflexota bacterium]